MPLLSDNLPLLLIPSLLSSTKAGDVSFRIMWSFEEVDDSITAFFCLYDGDFYPPISKRGSTLAFIEHIFETEGCLIVAEAENKVIAVMGISFNEPAWKYYYSYICIDIKYRRRRLTDNLMAIATELFLERGASRIIVQTWSLNLIQQNNFYRQGFIHFCTGVNERGNDVDTLYFTKVINPFSFQRQFQRLGIVGNLTPQVDSFIQSLTGHIRNDKSNRDILVFAEKDDYTLLQDGYPCISRAAIPAISHLLIPSLMPASSLFISGFCPDIEMISAGDFYRQMVAKNPSVRWLLVAGREAYEGDSSGSHFLTLPEAAGRERVHEIIQIVRSGMDYLPYKDEIVALAKEAGCSGIVLGSIDLCGLFGSHNQQYRGISVFDVLRELIFHLESTRQEKKNEPTVQIRNRITTAEH